MPEDASISEVISEFRKRANRAKNLAFGVLATIFMLLLGGAVAFIFAPQITLSDINNSNVDLENRLNTMRNEYNTLSEAYMKQNLTEREAYDIKYKTYVKHISNCYSQYISLFTKLAMGLPDIFNREGASQVDIIINESNVCNQKAILNLFTDEMKKLPQLIINVSNPLGVKNAYFRLQHGEIESVIEGLKNLKVDPPPEKVRQISAFDEILPIPERIKLLTQAINILEKEKSDAAISAMIGRKYQDKAKDEDKDSIKSASQPTSTLVQLIQTNVTRFGTIILIIFLVSILTPLYRYNIRLSSYYDARADALALSSAKLKSVGFSSLVSILTPSFDFGKSPSTPIEQIIKLIQQIKDEKKQANEDE